MPKYLSLLREASVNSVYILLILVIAFLFTKGRIKEREFFILFYIWLPIAVITQFFMTYYRVAYGESNLFIMNIYLILEFSILTYVLLKIRQKIKGVELNKLTWTIIILVGIFSHLIYKIDTIHNASMLYIVIIYFNLSVSFFDPNNIENVVKDPYWVLNFTIFIKAFGYSYFLIYQTDYEFPLIIFSAVNLLVQILFAYTLLIFYEKQESRITKIF